MKLTRESIQRMVGGNVGSGYVGGSGGSGGGGGVGAAWVDENYVSKAFFNQLFAAKGLETVYTSDDDGETWTQDGDPTEITFLPNEMPSEVIEDGETAGTKVKTVRSLRDTKSLLGLWTDQYLSALGRNSSSGGGVLAEPLASINSAGLGMPTEAGQVITWNGSQWIYDIPGGGGGGGTGTVTSITAGTGLSGGTITTMGTIAINSTYQGYIQHGEAAYNWGNHAQEGYLKVDGYGVLQIGTYLDFIRSNFTPSPSHPFSTRLYCGDNYENTVALPAGSGTLALLSDIMSALTGYATQGWVNSQGFLKANAISDMATQTWVNSQGFLKTATGTFWGKSWSNGGTVQGDIEAGDNGGIVKGFNGIELNTHNNMGSFGGYIDFHYIGSSYDYTTRLLETDTGLLKIIAKDTSSTDKSVALMVGDNVPNGSFLQIGNVRLVCDTSTNSLRVQGVDDNSPANLYALGAISALGKDGSGGGGDANESRSYTMPESGDANKWHRLGNYTMNSNGQVVCLDIFTGNGYNGQPYQNSWARIILKRSANTSGTASVVSVTCEQFGRSLGDGKILVRVNATDYNAGKVWVKCPWSNPLGAYTVQGNYSSWLHNANNNEDTSNPSYNQTTGYYDSTGSMSTTE